MDHSGRFSAFSFRDFRLFWFGQIISLSGSWMQTVAQGVMTTWSMFAIHDVMLREKTLFELAPKIGFLLVYGLVSFAIRLRLFRYSET